MKRKLKRERALGYRYAPHSIKDIYIQSLKYISENRIALLNTIS